MNLLSRFNQTFGFTKTESKVIIFLIAAFMIGFGIKVYKSVNPGHSKFDYSAVDSEFAALSSPAVVADSGDAGVNVGDYDSRPVTLAKKNPGKGSIDINRAGKTDLMKLPGIGSVIAERIIAYREKNGSFKSVNQISKVKGIGKKKLEKIAPYLTIGKK